MATLGGWNFPVLSAIRTRLQALRSRFLVTPPPPPPPGQPQAQLIDPNGNLTAAASYVVGQDIKIDTTISGVVPVNVQAYVDGVPGPSIPWSTVQTGQPVASQAIDLGFATDAEVGSHTAYTVVSLNNGTSVKTNNVIITVNPKPIGGGQLQGNIGASVASGIAPLAVNFQSAVSGGVPPYTHHWNFGDGSTSAAQNPSHTYASAGVFSVTDTVSDSVGNSITLGPITINVTPTPPPTDQQMQFVTLIVNQTGGDATWREDPGVVSPLTVAANIDVKNALGQVVALGKSSFLILQPGQLETFAVAWNIPGLVLPHGTYAAMTFCVDASGNVLSPTISQTVVV